MTCIKTGATVWFENYGIAVPADVYEIGDCYVIRWNPHGKVFRPAKDADWKVAFCNASVIWHRDDLGVTVVPQDMVDENFS